MKQVKRNTRIARSILVVFVLIAACKFSWEPFIILLTSGMAGAADEPYPADAAAEATPSAELSSQIAAVGSAEDILRAQTEQVNAQLRDTQLAFTRPETLIVGEKVEIKVGLLLPLAQAVEDANQQLSVELDVPQADLEIVTIQTTVTMRAELIGDPDAFKIIPLFTLDKEGKGPKGVLAGEVTEWRWEVTALKRGDYRLTLVLTPDLYLNGNPFPGKDSTHIEEFNVRNDIIITGTYLWNEYQTPLIAIGLLTTGMVAYFGIRRLLFRRMKRSLLDELDVAPPGVGKGHIFMSYSRRNEQFVVPLARDLIDDGIPIWIDQLEIAAGDNWKEALQNGISGTDAIMVVLSQDSIDSPYVQAEISMAIAAGKPFFAVQHKAFTFENMRKLENSGTKILSGAEVSQVIEKVDSTNFIDFSQDYPTGFDKLSKDLKRGIN